MKVSAASPNSTSVLDRRECLSALAAGLASLVVPRSVQGAESVELDDEVAPEPIGLPLVMELVGTYEVRLEWLFRGRILVENPTRNGTVGLLREDGQPEWVEHWRAREVPLTSEIRVQDGRLELHTNFVWSPPGSIFLGPGPIFSARIDGERQTTVEGRGAMRILRSVEQDEYNIVHEDSVCNVREWWYRSSSKTPFEPLQTRRSTLFFESPGMLVLDLYAVEAATPVPRETRESLRFRKISGAVVAPSSGASRGR
jgi:hypothetical protein